MEQLNDCKMIIMNISALQKEHFGYNAQNVLVKGKGKSGNSRDISGLTKMTSYSVNKYLIIYNMLGTREKMANKNRLPLSL